jgi:hypothetical protein
LNLLPSLTANDETTVAHGAALVSLQPEPPRWLTAEAKAEWRRVALARAAAAAHTWVDARELQDIHRGLGLMMEEIHGEIELLARPGRRNLG